MHRNIKAQLQRVVLIFCIVIIGLQMVGCAAKPAGDCEIKMGLLISLTGDLGDLGQGQLPAVEWLLMKSTRPAVHWAVKLW
jgi:hypothetical protein